MSVLEYEECVAGSPPLAARRVLPWWAWAQIVCWAAMALHLNMLAAVGAAALPGEAVAEGLVHLPMRFSMS